MTKYHLLDVSEPLLSFHKLTMRCGLEIVKAAQKFMWSEDLEKDLIIPFGTCIKCVKLKPENPEDKRTYTYGLAEAQESLTEDAA